MMIKRNWRKTHRIGQIFADMRKASDVSTIQLGKIFKCSPQNIQSFENGENDSLYIALYYLYHFNDGIIPETLVCKDGDILCREE